MGTAGIVACQRTCRLCLFRRQNNEKLGIYALLRGHTDRVNAIKFFLNPIGECRLLVSGSSDGKLRLWQTQSRTGKDFREVTCLEGHASSVNCLCINEAHLLIVSGSADGTLKIWRVDLQQESKASLVQTIKTDLQLLPLALASADLSSKGSVILAVAGTKGIVQIWITNADFNFELQATLVGHESWVRFLAITEETEQPHCDLLLASASQDKYIRLWRIRRDISANGSVSTERNFMISLSNKAHRLKAAEGTFSLTFEALLLGHEDWIYTVQWCRRHDGLRLLSASADNSLAIWEAEQSSGIWVCNTRLGEISSRKGSTTATGSAGGFWIGLWSPTGDSVLSLGRTGSWRKWTYDSQTTRWTQSLGISGHIKSVTDIAWAKDGAYLLSTGLDQTTRLHASWKHEDRRSWHELARPQIHGYDLNCIDSIGLSQFVSGADEKALRIFGEPKAVASLLERLCGISQPTDQSLPDAATMPMLGLSNKAVDELDDVEPIAASNNNEPDAPGPGSVMSAKTLDLDHPPLEDHLARHTLWPEKEKLYGHGYEISAVAASHDGTVIATACKASSIDHAVIRLYETNGWREIKPALTAHSLTATCLRFSNDDRYLLSVGRDRQWAIFERDESRADLYKSRIQNLKGHSRMILNSCWAPLDAGRIFATAGRDKAVKIWKFSPDPQEIKVDCVATFMLAAPVTAIDIVPHIVKGGLVIAIGTEDGEILVYMLWPDMSVRQSCKMMDT